MDVLVATVEFSMMLFHGIMSEIYILLYLIILP